MSVQELVTKLREMEGNAAPGKWETGDNSCGVLIEGIIYPTGWSYQNDIFIARARNSLPTLLRIIERYENTMGIIARPSCLYPGGQREACGRCSTCLARAALTDCDTLAKKGD